MADFGLTSEGYVAPRAADFLVIIQDAIVAELVAQGLNPDIDFEHDVVWGITSAIMAVQLGQLGQLTQGCIDAYDINNATGLFLDSIGALRGIPRLPAEYTRVDLLLTNTTGKDAFLESGQAIAEGGGLEDRQKWVITEDATIPAGGDITVEFRSQVTGNFEAGVGEIDVIVTAVDGWESVSNAAIPSPGRDIETNDEYRLRQQQGLVPSLGQNGNALRASLELLGGVESAGVIENETGAQAVVEGVSLAPHSKAVFIAPNTLTADQVENVGQVIYQQTDFGIFTNGFFGVAIQGADGFTKVVRFSYATESVVAWNVTLTLDSGFVLSDVEPQVRANVTTYFGTLAVGGDVLWLRVLSAIAQVTGVLNAALLLNGLAEDVEVFASEVAVEGSIVVTT